MSTSPIHSRHYAILITIHNQSIPTYDIEEMKGMAKTAGYTILQEIEQNLGRINTKYFLGKGKMEQIKIGLSNAFMSKKEKRKIQSEFELEPNPFLNVSSDNEINPFQIDLPEQEEESIPELIEPDEPEIEFNFPNDIHSPHQITILFNNRIGNIQILNLQRDWNTTVIDRDHLILEIFELHAGTRESKLQIELARMAMETSLIKKELGQHLSEHQGAGFMGKGMSGYVPVQRAYTNRKKKSLMKSNRSEKIARYEGKNERRSVTLGLLDIQMQGKPPF